MRLNAVLHQPGVDAQRVGGVGFDLLDRDAQLLAGLALDDPHTCRPVGGLRKPARWAHPIQRLARPGLGLDTHRSVALDHQLAARGRKSCGYSPEIVDVAPGYHETHASTLD